MIVALFHGFANFHYEMFGYLIEYFLDKNINFTIYSHFNQTKNEWEEYYNNLFNIKLPWSFIGNFSHHKYKYVILITDDDILYLTNQQYFQSINKTKIITIDHSPTNRTPDVYKKISVRKFNNYDYVLPVYKNIDFIYKKKLLNQSNKKNKIIVSLIGASYVNSVEKLKKIFTNYNLIQFNLFTRSYNNEFDSESNISVFKNCNTSLMMSMIAKSHYVLLNIEASQYKCNQMSGSIPLAIGFLCKLIIPKSWVEYYEIINVLSYDDNTSIELTQNINLKELEIERENILKKRNNLLNNCLI